VFTPGLLLPFLLVSANSSPCICFITFISCCNFGSVSSTPGFTFPLLPPANAYSCFSFSAIIFTARLPCTITSAALDCSLTAVRNSSHVFGRITHTFSIRVSVRQMSILAFLPLPFADPLTDIGS
jgi:hypothetical protein